MAQVPLAFDSVARRFTVRAGIALRAARWGVDAPIGNWIHSEFVVDSGSNRTAINEQAAQRLGVDVERLALAAVRSATGFAQRPVLSQADILFLAEKEETVRLPIITVLRTMSSPRDGRPGGSLHRSADRIPGPCLLGTDALEALGARLMLDFRKKVGVIEW